MSLILKHNDGIVDIVPDNFGNNRITVRLIDSKLFMPTNTCCTSYPPDLIEKILDVKGPTYLCDEILRDENPMYVQHGLRYGILSYVPSDTFDGKKILDFGCGCGSSTMILARMFPNAEIVGVELVADFLSVAKLRSKFYRLDNVSFMLSEDSNSIPDNIGNYDYVILTAVYEHLLLKERIFLLEKIWSNLKQGGVLFINQTPNRYFPFESHTTGLPLINYFPDGMTLYLSRKFSKRVKSDDSWELLLRRGIRGGTTNEIITILSRGSGKPILLEPNRLGIKDQIDLWYKESRSIRFPIIKKIMFFIMRIFKFFTGINLTPDLSLAIKKVN